MDAAPDKPVNSQTMEANMTNTIETAKALTFGTELEYTNISRERAAKAIHSVVGGTIRFSGGHYDEWTVIAPDGRRWKAISDGSLGSRATSAEVVTPILRWDDLETLQAVVRALRHAGAKTPECTSQHVHVGIGSRREISAANQPAKTNGPPVLHDKAAHFAGILDAFKGDDTLSGLDGSNGVVGTLFRAGDE